MQSANVGTSEAVALEGVERTFFHFHQKADTIGKMPASSSASDNFGPEDRKALTELLVHMEYVKTTVRDLAQSVPDKAVIEIMRVDVGKLQAEVETLKQFRWYVLGGALTSGAAGGFAIFKALH